MRRIPSHLCPSFSRKRGFSFLAGLERKLLKKSANCDIIHTTVMYLVICCEYGSSRKEPIVIFIGDVFILCKRFLSQKDFLGFRDEAYE